MSELCKGVYDERANDKGAISRFLSDKSANASGSILYLYERMNARRCKINLLCSTLWVGENRKVERGTLQLNLITEGRQQPKLLRSAMMISFQIYMRSSRYAPQSLQRAVNVKGGRVL